MTPWLRRLAVLAALAAAAGLFFGLGLQDYLSLATLKARQSELAAMFDARPLLVAGIFFAIQATALALSLPGAVLTLSLAAGAIFGPVWGTVIALLAITFGDSLGFLAARYLFRDWVERTFAAQAAAVDRGVERDGAFYLLSLRLMAVVPYFIVNLTMGLTRMKLRVFAPVSFAGLLPATAIYVNAGTRIAAIDTPADIYSPGLIGAFVLLGLFPLAIRFALRRRSPAGAIARASHLP